MKEEPERRPHACPLEVSFDIAEELIAGRGLADEARLALRLSRQCLASARRRYGCDSAVAPDGQASCPLEGMSMQARSIAGQVLALYTDADSDGSVPGRPAVGEPPGGTRRGAGPYL